MFIELDVQREYARVPFKRYVDIEFISDTYGHCQVKDLSLNGMFIIGKFKNYEGKLCIISLEQNVSTTELSLSALAKVVRQDEKGMAIQFSSMTFESYIYLQVFLLHEARGYIGA